MTTPPDVATLLPDVAAVGARLEAQGYLADRGLATAMLCAARLRHPLLLEGEAGVGKTEAAKALAAALDTPLVRLQCYEGIDASEALYEWDYPRQLLAIRIAEVTGAVPSAADLHGPDHLLERPILAAVRHPGPRPAVLLVDEVDRADDEFEAFLLEVLAEASVTIPELGTVRAVHPPIVVLTSNRTRDLADALKRRCLYHWIEHPDLERTIEIVRRRVPDAAPALTEVATAAVLRLRALDLEKPPGVAEAIDWVRAMDLLGATTLDLEVVDATLGAALKERDDLATARSRPEAWLGAG